MGIRTIIEYLSRIEGKWRLDGSVNLLVQGMKVNPKDIDIAADDLVSVRKNFDVKKDYFSKERNCQTIELEIEGVAVEINFYIDERAMFDKIEEVEYKGATFKVLPLKYAQMFYEIIGRKERVEEIKAFLDKSL